MSKETKNADKSSATTSDNAGINTGVAIIGFILCFLAGGSRHVGLRQPPHEDGGGITADTAAAAAAAQWADKDSPIPVTSKDPMWGNRDAPVTIVIFSRLPVPVLLARRADARPGQDDVRPRQGPHRLEEPAAAVPRQREAGRRGRAGRLRAQGQRRVLEVPRHRVQEPERALARELREVGRRSPASTSTQFKAGARRAQVARRRSTRTRRIGKKVGANGTPAFRINGVELSGAQPFDKFKEVIDKELGKAQAKIASGTPKDKIYVAMSTENFKNAPAPKKDDDEEGEKEDTRPSGRCPSATRPVHGKADALVTIIEFSDFQCPYCKRVEPTLKKIRETYGDKVRLVWKHEPLPFHPRAEPAAELALEARARRATRASGTRTTSSSTSQPKLEDADLEKAASDLGLDVDKVEGRDQGPQVQEGDRRRRRPRRRRPGQRHAALLHQRPPPRRRAAVREVPEDHRRGDQEVRRPQKGKVAGKDFYDALMKDGEGRARAGEEGRAAGPRRRRRSRAARTRRSSSRSSATSSARSAGASSRPVNEVMKTYGDKVKFVWRDKPLPMHPDAPLAAEAASRGAQAEGPRRLLEDARQAVREPAEAGSSATISRATPRSSASTWTSSRPRSTTTTHKAAIDADDKAGNDAGISGTPAFLINGYFVSGAQPFPKFKKLIDTRARRSEVVLR